MAAPSPGAKQRWILHDPASDTRYVIRLSGPALVADCYPESAAGRTHGGAEMPSPPAEPAPRDAAMLVAAAASEEAADEPVSWSVASWHQPDRRTLRIVLAAVDLPLAATVDFVLDDTGILTRHTTIRHDGNGPDVNIAATLAFWVGVHEPIDHMRYLAGAWARETELRPHLGDTPLRLESRVGKTGFDFQPYVALRAGGTTYLCQIFWSGNWALEVVPRAGGAALFGGLNDWRFRCRLGGAASSLPLPMVIFGRFEGGLNAATHRLHDYRRARRPDPERPIAVQFNSWYPYLGEPNAEAMLALVPLAQRLGCEAFVVDAGWYKTDEGESAGDWMARTGDWRTSRQRFPKGLREVSARCREHGLKFGLWFEPEVIGSLSAIRRDHPEWLHHVGGRPPAPQDRAILNLGIPAARRHAFDRVTRILSAVGVDWMKWDFNADFGAGGWAPDLPRSLTDQDPLVAHYEGVYRLQDAIRRWFPNLTLEMCASGGGRMDGALLSHAHANWLSDQPGPVRKLAIHVGSQLAHPAVVCNDWLIEWPPGSIAGYDDEDSGGLDERGDLPFRLRSAMLGSFGISARIDRWREADFAVAAAHVALYREKLRPIIHHGDQYLLTKAPPGDGNGDWAALWYAAKDGASGVLFAFRLAKGEASRSFPLPGLVPDQCYRVSFFSRAASEMRGDALTGGLVVAIPAPFQSALCYVERC
ncbi:MAG TPA: alpha-galactosidase [Stellaceae bacterium]|nr:alpha-galactosidase [Stellaceae bacterium]